MSNNCGHGPAVVHMHNDSCYRAGKRDGRAEVDAQNAEIDHMPCDMGCQPDWHRDDCAIYLSAPQTSPGGPGSAPRAEESSSDVRDGARSAGDLPSPGEPRTRPGEPTAGAASDV